MTAARPDLGNPGRPLLEACERALAKLEHLMRQQPKNLTSEVDVAERCLAAMRDHLIEHLRRDPDSELAARRRKLLERTNVAISLVVGVEYPATGIQWKALEQARDVVREVLAAERSSPAL